MLIQRSTSTVMGHVGLMPQSLNIAGGFKVQGRGQRQADRVAADAAAIAPLPSRQGHAQSEQEGTRRSRRGYGYITTESKTDKPG
jgi:hypothetical protein